MEGNAMNLPPYNGHPLDSLQYSTFPEATKVHGMDSLTHDVCRLPEKYRPDPVFF